MVLPGWLLIRYGSDIHYAYLLCNTSLIVTNVFAMDTLVAETNQELAYKCNDRYIGTSASNIQCLMLSVSRNGRRERRGNPLHR